MRKGRGIDHNWQIRKYSDDVVLYARCRCGYEYPCSSNKGNIDGVYSFEQEITKLYAYCPCCGAHKKWYDPAPVKVKVGVDACEE